MNKYMNNSLITVISISFFLITKGHSENAFKIFQCTREYARANHVQTATHLSNKNSDIIKISDARFFAYCCKSEVLLENKNYLVVENFFKKNIRNLNYNNYDNIDFNNNTKESKPNKNNIISDEEKPVGLAFPERSVVITGTDFEIIIILINENFSIYRADPLIIDKSTGLYTIKDLCNISLSEKETKNLINLLFPNPLTDDKFDQNQERQK